MRGSELGNHMTLLETETRPAGAGPFLPLATHLGSVRIAVTDGPRALTTWRDIVGLNVLAETGNEIKLGIGGDTLIVLETGASGPVVPNTLGLYHVAIHVPERQDLARFVARALATKTPISPTDHLVSEAVYLWDSDGNGIEMTFETPWRGTLSDQPELGSYGITTEGKPHSGREAIDLDDLMAEMKGDDTLTPRLPEGARIGHVHVHVKDLDEAMRFYADIIGFKRQFVIGFFGMGDVALDYVPHIVAFNTWSGRNAAQPPPGTAGLRWFTIVLPDATAMAGVKSRLDAAGIASEKFEGGIATRDPAGNCVRLLVSGS
jgi:catechol 2,3-dioxygenase